MSDIEEGLIYRDNVDSYYVKIIKVLTNDMLIQFHPKLLALKNGQGLQTDIKIDEFVLCIKQGIYTLIKFKPENWNEVLEK